MTTAATKRQAAKGTVCEHLSIADLCSECIAKAVRRAGLDDAQPAPAEKKVRKQRGATKAQLAHRAKLFGSASPSIHDDLDALKVVR